MPVTLFMHFIVLEGIGDNLRRERYEDGTYISNNGRTCLLNYLTRSVDIYADDSTLLFEGDFHLPPHVLVLAPRILPDENRERASQVDALSTFALNVGLVLRVDLL